MILAGFGLCAARESRGGERTTHFGSAKRCVLVWLDGGPSHLETFDPKPLAAAEVRGPLGVIKTRHPGEVFGEGLPELAARSDRFSVVRSTALQEAIDLLSDQHARQAFNLERESQQTRRRYGSKPIGQNCLLARRLLEAGVPIVTVNNKGWDTHDRLHERLHAGYIHSGARTTCLKLKSGHNPRQPPMCPLPFNPISSICLRH